MDSPSGGDQNHPTSRPLATPSDQDRKDTAHIQTVEEIGEDKLQSDDLPRNVEKKKSTTEMALEEALA